MTWRLHAVQPGLQVLVGPRYLLLASAHCAHATDLQPCTLTKPLGMAAGRNLVFGVLKVHAVEPSTFMRTGPLPCIVELGTGVGSSLLLVCERCCPAPRRVPLLPQVLAARVSCADAKRPAAAGGGAGLRRGVQPAARAEGQPCGVRHRHRRQPCGGARDPLGSRQNIVHSMCVMHSSTGAVSELVHCDRADVMLA